MIEVQEPQPPPSGGQNGSGTGGVPEAGWGSKDSRRVNLYSENVVKEPDSTEVVDRESIANLASTRGKWEAIFTAEPREDSQAAKPSKPAPKWQVRMPYAEKRSVGPDTVTSNNQPSDDEDDDYNSPRSAGEAQTPDMESAIEREIRLAMEREDMLKREQEQRLRQLSQQASAATATGGKGVSSMESSTESELQQPSFHELTEADRGAPFYLNNGSSPAAMLDEEPEGVGMDSPHKGLGLQKGRGGGEESATESIIEREIRLQREREAELALQRGGRSHDNLDLSMSSPRQQQQQQQQQQPLSLPEEEERGGGVMWERGAEVEEIPYEEAISRYNHDGESRIAQELREVREREEEVRRLRERMNNANITATTTTTNQSSPSPSSSSSLPSQPPRHSMGSRSTPATPRGGGGGLEKTPTVSFNTSRSVHNSPRLETHTNTPSPNKAPPKVKQETPIEREIRLARDRENELRRSKGLPELKPEPPKQESVEVDDEELEERREGGVVLTPRHYHSPYHPSPPDNTMRRFATNRLQQEMQIQRDREMKLRQEGKIISTSEEHILPGRYAEVVGQGQDNVDSGSGGGGVVKRNFRVNPSQQQQQRRNSNASQDSNNSADSSTPRQPHASTANTATTPRGGGGGGGKKAGTGAVSFSYREFAQTAESKIERELREMREREEELRKLRGGGTES